MIHHWAPKLLYLSIIFLILSPPKWDPSIRLKMYFEGRSKLTAYDYLIIGALLFLAVAALS